MVFKAQILYDKICQNIFLKYECVDWSDWRDFCSLCYSLLITVYSSRKKRKSKLWKYFRVGYTLLIITSPPCVRSVMWLTAFTDTVSSRSEHTLEALCLISLSLWVMICVFALSLCGFGFFHLTSVCERLGEENECRSFICHVLCVCREDKQQLHMWWMKVSLSSNRFPDACWEENAIMQILALMMMMMMMILMSSSHSGLADQSKNSWRALCLCCDRSVCVY